jgi:antitoxin component YwqK of YwqJK toxin-antitoxin module
MANALEEGKEVHGKKHGPWTVYYANGNKRSQGVYKEGQRHGDWNYYHKSGGVDYTVSFKEGKNIGSTVSYYEGGKLKQKGQYNEFRGKSTDGKKTGPWTFYAEDGKTVWRIITYKNGARAQADEHPLGHCTFCGKVRQTAKPECSFCGEEY